MYYSRIASHIIASTLPKLLFIGIILTIFSSCATNSDKSPNTVKYSATTNKLFEQLFNQSLALSPEEQTYLGINTNNHLWDDRSETQQQKKHQLKKNHLETLRNIDESSLDAQTKLSLRLYKQELINTIDDYPWRHHSYPVNQMFGVHSEIPALLINTHQVNTLKDAQDYLARLKGVPNVISQLIDMLEIRKNKGIIAPKFVFPYAITDSANIISGSPFDQSTDNPLWADFNNKIEQISIAPDVKQSLIQQVRNTLLNDVGPAYSQLISYLKKLEHLADTRDGAWKLPNGLSFYNNALRRTTTTDLSAQQIHAIGLKEVKRIHNDMRAIMKRVNYKGNLQEFFHFMRTDKQFYYANNDEGRESYLQANIDIIDKIEQNLDALFLTKPLAKLDVKRVEAFREKSAGKAFYQPPAPDGSRPGRYYANLYDMNNMPSYQMEALAYHEGIPGHHMQISIAQELKGLPKFRKYGFYTAYTEGWGLYSEYIPKELGFYSDPYSDFGRLAMELWRACRLVVDTGIHAKRWNRQKAIDYLVNNTPNPKEDSVRAIERYIVLPSQATAYKIGMLKILELRESAQQQLNEKFNLPEFHDVILKNGAVPLDILETLVNNWINSKQ